MGPEQRPGLVREGLERVLLGSAGGGREGLLQEVPSLARVPRGFKLGYKRKELVDESGMAVLKVYHVGGLKIRRSAMAAKRLWHLGLNNNEQ